MNNELRHFGILGMKWGVRRYQNADGTLTSEGKEHYGKLHNHYLDKIKSREKRWADSAKTAKNHVKEISKMSDAEFAKKYIEYDEPDPGWVRELDIDNSTSRAKDYALFAAVDKIVYNEVYNKPLGSLKNEKEYYRYINNLTAQILNEKLATQPIENYDILMEYLEETNKK